jgi:hypothetical protein
MTRGAGETPAVARASCPCRLTAKMAVPQRAGGSSSEGSWALGPPMGMKVPVILSEAKDLQFRSEMNQCRFFASLRMTDFRESRSEGVPARQQARHRQIGAGCLRYIVKPV